jgi:mannose-6-phosphate isomerase-like protein (cupin superfamily)
MEAGEMETKPRMEKKSLNAPDETRTMEKGRIELATVGNVNFGRAILQPGWKWSTHVKPIAKTKSCEAPHMQYFVSGRLHIVMDDGSQDEFGPGDVGIIPPGHDAWVVGSEPVVAIDINGLKDYGKPKK